VVSLSDEPDPRALDGGTATAEDAVAAGAYQASDNEQHEAENHLALKKLHHTCDCDYDCEKPQQHESLL
jgi:hypothetical protein